MILDRIKNLYPRGHFARNVITLAGGTAGGQILVVLASPILTRLYTPEDFGVLATFISIFSLLLIINSLRYELAIPIAEDDKTAASVLILVFVLVVLTSAAFALGFWLLSDQIVNWVNTPGLKPYLWLLALCLMGAGFYQALTYWTIRKKAFAVLAQTKLVQGVWLVIVQMGLGVFSIGSGGLLAGYTVGQVAGSLALSRIAFRENKSIFEQVRLPDILEAAKRFRRFPLFSSWSSLLNTGGLQLPPLFIAAIYGPTVAGWFALSQRIIGIPMTVVGTSVGQVYFATASQLVHDNPNGLPSFFNRTAGRLLLISFLPIAFIGISGPWLFEYVLGENWRVAGEFVQIMAPMFLAQFVVSTLAQTIIILERQDIQSLWDIARLVIVIGVFLVSALLQLEAKWAISLYSISMVFTYITLFVLNRHILRVRMKENFNARNKTL